MDLHQTAAPDEQPERQLRIELMKADISNKNTDSAYKLQLTRWEPWKAMSVAFGAGAAAMAAATTLAAFAIRAFLKL